MASTDHIGALTRRQFVGASAGAAGVLALGGLNPLIARGADGPLLPPGKRSIILFTVRDRIEAAPDDSGLPYRFERVFARLAEIGYHGIEFAGYAQHTQILGRQITPAEIRTALDDNGLVAVGNTETCPARSHLRPLPRSTRPWTPRRRSARSTSEPAATRPAAPWRPTGMTRPSAGTSWASGARRVGSRCSAHNHDAACNLLLDSGPLDALGRPTRSSGIRKLEYSSASPSPHPCTSRWTSIGRTWPSTGSALTRTRTATCRPTCSTRARSWRPTASGSRYSMPRTESARANRRHRLGLQLRRVRRGRLVSAPRPYGREERREVDDCGCSGAGTKWSLSRATGVDRRGLVGDRRAAQVGQCGR